MQIAFCLFGLPRHNKNTIKAINKLIKEININSLIYAHCWDYEGGGFNHHKSKDNLFAIPHLFDLLLKTNHLRGFLSTKQEVIKKIVDTDRINSTNQYHMWTSAQKSLDLVYADIDLYGTKIDFVIFTRYDLLLNIPEIAIKIKELVYLSKIFHSGHLNHDGSFSAEDLIFGLPIKKTNGLFNNLKNGQLEYKGKTYAERKIYNPLLFEIEKITDKRIEFLSAIKNGNLFIRRFNLPLNLYFYHFLSLFKFLLKNKIKNKIKFFKLTYKNRWHYIRRIRSEKARFQQRLFNFILGRKKVKTDLLYKTIKNKISEKKSFFIGRLGSVETKTFTKSYLQFSSNSKNINFAKGCGGKFTNRNHFEFAKQEYFNSISEIDLIGMWDFVYKEAEIIERYCADESIKFNANLILNLFFDEQYNIGKLFKNKSICIVNSNIITIKNTLRNKNIIENGFWKEFSEIKFIYTENPNDNNTDWITELKRIQLEVEKTNSDLYLLSSGSFSQPIGAYIKTKMKKSSINIGGYIQLITGTPGKRFKYDNEYKKYLNMLQNKGYFYEMRNEIPNSLKNTEMGDYLK